MLHNQTFLDYTLQDKKKLPHWGDQEEVDFIDSEIYSLSEKELRQIAQDLAEGKIFTDRNCKTPEEFLETFPVLGMLKWKSLEDQQKWAENLGMIFEYNDKAMILETDEDPPQLVRMFLSFRLLNKTDADKMLSYFKFTKVYDA